MCFCYHEIHAIFISLVFSLLYYCFCIYITLFYFFFFNDTATTEIYTLSLHDALPISGWAQASARARRTVPTCAARYSKSPRSEEHTSELQSQSNLVCRLLLEKKKKQRINETI